MRFAGRVGTPPIPPLSLFVFGQASVGGSTRPVVYRSTDFTSFSRLTVTEAAATTVIDVVALPIGGSEIPALFALQANGKLYRSLDFGSTWSLQGTFTSPDCGIGVTQNTDGTNKRIYSLDSGTTTLQYIDYGTDWNGTAGSVTTNTSLGSIVSGYFIQRTDFQGFNQRSGNGIKFINLTGTRFSGTSSNNNITHHYNPDDPNYPWYAIVATPGIAAFDTPYTGQSNGGSVLTSQNPTQIFSNNGALIYIFNNTGTYQVREITAGSSGGSPSTLVADLGTAVGQSLSSAVASNNRGVACHPDHDMVGALFGTAGMVKASKVNLSSWSWIDFSAALPDGSLTSLKTCIW